MVKGLGSPNPPLPAKQPVFFIYILEKAETPREMRRSFSPQRTGERRPRPDSPDSASILSVRNKNGSLQRPGCALDRVRPTIAIPGDRRLHSVGVEVTGRPGLGHYREGGRFFERCGKNAIATCRHC